jgi:tetratricopeptide (TPR) repeat protein
LVLIALLVAGTPVFAQRVLAQDGSDISEGQRAAGEALFASGKAAYRAGNYSEALRSFEQALARLGRPAIYEDIGDAAAKMGDHQRSIDAYREYLGAHAKAPDRADVERRIKIQQVALAEAGGGVKPDLSPSAAANAGQDAEESSAAEQTPTADANKRSGGELWWVWAGIGAAVVGTVVAALIVTSGSDPVQPPMRGSVGGTIRTLEVR